MRKLDHAVWLWDAARGRIVWANAAGVAYFSGESVFDLIDRPFDGAEPGVEAITAVAARLQRGETETVLLHFPSSGHTVPLQCQCCIHALADGRNGLLVIDMTNKKDQALVSPERLQLAFDLLPLAASFMGHDGSLHQLNVAARSLLDPSHRANLAEVVADAARAQDMLVRLVHASTVSEILKIDTLIGPREVRFTLKRLVQDNDPVAYATVLLDDITERRILERQFANVATQANDPVPALSAPPPATVKSLAPAEAEAFHSLGKMLNSAQPRVNADELEPPSAPSPRRQAPELPAIIKANLERAHEAIIVARDGALIYANSKALEILGQDSLCALLNDDPLWHLFAERTEPVSYTELHNAQGQLLKFSAKTTQIAWQGGPARQFVLTSYNKAGAETLLPQPLAIQRAAGAEKKTLPTENITAPPETPEIRVPPVSVQSGSPASASPAADDELRAILDTATDGIITLDKTGRIHTFSAGAEAIFGYRIAEVVDKPFAELLATDSRKILRDYLAALQGPGLASVFNDGREVTAIVSQGGTVPLFLTIGPLQSKSSKAAFCAVVRDITQWKRTESDLREAKENAEAMSRQKSEFLARISHELRTPLNAILGFSEVMRLERFGEIKNDKYKGYVNDIHSSGALLLSLINDLLDLSKVEAGQLELNFTSVNLSDTVESAMRMLQETATSARVVIRKSLPQDLPNVVADLRSMRQILLNVISNAIKFTDPGGQVIISALVNKAGELKLRVKDTGIGMDAAQLRDALEPFKRVTTQGRDVQGTGLGLPLTKALAEANRTIFSITSEARKGTLVELTFPTTRVLAD